MVGHVASRKGLLIALWASAGAIALVYGALQYVTTRGAPRQASLRPSQLQMAVLKAHDSDMREFRKQKHQFNYDNSDWHTESRTTADMIMTVGGVAAMAATFGAGGLAAAAAVAAAKKAGDNTASIDSPHTRSEWSPSSHGNQGYRGKMNENTSSFQTNAKLGSMQGIPMGQQVVPMEAAPLEWRPADTPLSNALATLDIGQMYESQDFAGQWWPVMVDARNFDGSYTCCVVPSGSPFERTRIWSTVWPSNCRAFTPLAATISAGRQDMFPNVPLTKKTGAGFYATG